MEFLCLVWDKCEASERSREKLTTAATGLLTVFVFREKQFPLIVVLICGRIAFVVVVLVVTEGTYFRGIAYILVAFELVVIILLCHRDISTCSFKSICSFKIYLCAMIVSYFSRHNST